MAKHLPVALAIVPKQAHFLLDAPPADLGMWRIFLPYGPFWLHDFCEYSGVARVLLKGQLLPKCVAQEFSKIALNIILQGDVAARGYAKAANALQVTVDAVDQGVKMLCDIFIRGAQSNLSSVQMIQFLAGLGFHEETRECLADYFTQRLNDIRILVAIPRLSVPSYRKLEWRLDVQLASRSLMNQAEPSFVLKLSLNREYVREAGMLIDYQSQLKAQNKEKAEKDAIYLEANYATLKAICIQLEQALSERRSMRSRRIVRQLQ